MNDRVKMRYDEWELVLRAFIRKAEDVRQLGSVEVAKSLLLYGIKLYDDLNKSALSEKDRLSFVNEMRRRTGLVLQHVTSRPQGPEEILFTPKDLE